MPEAAVRPAAAMETTVPGVGVRLGHALAAADPGLRRALEVTGAGTTRALAYLSAGRWTGALTTAAGLAKAVVPAAAPEGEHADEPGRCAS